jgi:hypothetical protein
MNLPKDTFKEFFDLAFERQRIYCFKTMGVEKPWTRDPLLQKGFFCNVFRKLDKTTKWIEKYVNEPYKHKKNFWKTAIMARMISYIPTLEILKNHNCLYGNWEEAKDILHDIAEMEGTVFSGAFKINAGGFGNKIDYLCYLLEEIEKKYPDFDERIVCGTLEYLHKILKGFPCIGDSMAYEYVIDFTYTYKKDSSDIHTWCVLGTGAKRGLNRLFNGTSSIQVPKNYLTECRQILTLWKTYAEKTLPLQIFNTKYDYEEKKERTLNNKEKLFITNCFRKNFNNLTMREVAHWLCEYDKYKAGKCKRKYNGEKRFPGTYKELIKGGY